MQERYHHPPVPSVSTSSVVRQREPWANAKNARIDWTRSQRAAKTETIRLARPPAGAPHDVIVDTASYPEWNPYIIDVSPDVDISVVGIEFVLTVDQPFQLFHTESPEKTSEVLLPDGRRAKLVSARFCYRCCHCRACTHIAQKA